MNRDLVSKAILSISILLLSAFSPIIYAQVGDDEERLRISLSEEGHPDCPSFIFEDTIFAEHPLSSTICVELDYRPEQLKQANLSLSIFSPSSSEYIHHLITQQWLFQDQEGYRNHLFTFPYIPADDLTEGEYEIHAEIEIQDHSRTTINSTSTFYEEKIGSVRIGSIEAQASVDIISQPPSIPSGGNHQLQLLLENTGQTGSRYIIVGKLNGTEVGSVDYSLPAGLQGYTTLPIQFPIDTPSGNHVINVEVYQPANPSTPLDYSHQNITVVPPYSNFEVSKLSVTGLFEGSANNTMYAGENTTLQIQAFNSGSLNSTVIPTYVLDQRDSIYHLNSQSSAVTIPAGESYTWTEQLFVPMNATVGESELLMIWTELDVEQNHTVDIKILPVRQFGIATLDSVDLEGMFSVSVENTGHYHTGYTIDWRVTNALHPDVQYQGMTETGILPPHTNTSLTISPFEQICSIGRWTLDLDLTTIERQEVVHQVHSFSLLNSTVPNAWLDIGETSLQARNLDQGGEVNLSLSLSSSPHNCGPIDFPYRIHLIGDTETWIEERSLRANSGITHPDVPVSIEIPHHLPSGEYTVIVETFHVKSGDHSFATWDVTDVGVISVQGEGPVAELLSCNHSPITREYETTLIQCNVQNQGRGETLARISATKDGQHSLSRIVTLMEGQSQMVPVDATGANFGDNTWNISLEALHDGGWILLDSIIVSSQLENPFSNLNPLGDISVTPWPPTAGQQVNVFFNSTGIETNDFGEIQLFLTSEDTLLTNPDWIWTETWSLGEVKNHAFSFHWPSDCEEYQIQVIRNDTSSNSTATEKVDSCKSELPDLTFSSFEYTGSDGIISSVLNNGHSISKPTEISIWLDGQEFSTLEIPSLGLDETFSWNLNNLPNYVTMQVIIDPENKVNEIIEGGASNSYSSGIPILIDSPDSDGDGLSDEDELNGWDIYIIDSRSGFDCYFEEMDTDSPDILKCIQYVGKFTSDPWKIDTDDDGLSDRFEFDNRLNPRHIDTDGDGMSDFYEANSGDDPQVVELNQPEILAIEESDLSANGDTSGRLIGELWEELFATRIVRHFEVQDTHLSNGFIVLVEIQDPEGNTVREIEPTLVSHTPESGMAQYTVSFATTVGEEWGGFKVVVNATDDYGNFNELEIANQSSLGKRVFTALYSLTNAVLPGNPATLLMTPVAATHGIAMGIFTGLKDIVSLVGMIPGLVGLFIKSLWKPMLCVAVGAATGGMALAAATLLFDGCNEQLFDIAQKLLTAAGGVKDWLDSTCFNYTFAECMGNISGAGKKAYAKGKASSIYSMSDTLYSVYLFGFVAGYIFFDLVVAALTLGSINALKALVKVKKSGTALRTFFDTSMDAMPCLVRYTSGRAAASTACKGYFDEVTNAIAKGKRIGSKMAKRIAISQADQATKHMWSKAIKISKTGDSDALLKFIKSDEIQKLKKISMEKRSRFWAEVDFMENVVLKNADDPDFMKHLPAWKDEFAKGGLDDAIRNNPEQFTLHMNDPGNGAYAKTKLFDKDPGAIKGLRGELRAIEPNCRKILLPAGEIDKLCFLPDGSIIKKEVKTVADPAQTLKHNIRQVEGDRVDDLVKHLDGADNPLEEYIRLACGNKVRADCDMDIPRLEDEFKTLNDAHKSGKYSSEYQFIDNSGPNSLRVPKEGAPKTPITNSNPVRFYEDVYGPDIIRQCLQKGWAPAHCQAFLDDLEYGWKTYDDLLPDQATKARKALENAKLTHTDNPVTPWNTGPTINIQSGFTVPAISLGHDADGNARQAQLVLAAFCLLAAIFIWRRPIEQ